MGTLDKIEELYLKIFKVVIIVVLSLALLVSLIMAVKGLTQMSATPNDPAPAQPAPAPSVNVQDFINQLESDKTNTAPKPSQEPPKPIPTPKDTSADDMVEKYLTNLWNYYNKYQQECNPPTKVQEDIFKNNFPKQVMKTRLERYGVPFLDSQDAFMKTLLSHQAVILYCKAKQGEGKIFFRSLRWHDEEYQKQYQRARAFEEKEEQRIAAFKAKEASRVLTEQAEGLQSLLIAGGAFGTFMLLALLLIFSKIETNLRGVKLEREGID